MLYVMKTPNTPTNEDRDDDFVGRILSRREVFALFGAMGAAGLVAGFSQKATRAQQPNDTNADSFVYLPIVSKAQSTPTPTATATNAPTATPLPTLTPNPLTPTPTLTPTGTIVQCVARPEKTEGPFFVDELLNRSDIRSDPGTGALRPGAQFNLAFRAFNISNSCAALPNAQVDIWHCDASGLYSDVAQNGTSGQKFLRGYQLTNTNGIVNFVTIYPGWYISRAVHIHFKIRLNNLVFTSQLFFDDTFTDQVYALAPYNTRGARTTRNSNDNIYGTNGSELQLTVAQSGGVYSATFDIGLVIE
jgi:protocatechuate 3,4-dioxygenase beta subunit